MKTCTICKQSKELSEFNKNKCRKDGLQTKCKECSKSLYLNHKNKHPKYYIIRNKKRKYENRIWVLNYLKDHPCIDCGEPDPLVPQFDHISGIKEYNISYMISCGYALNALKKEIEKCSIRCANCHMRKTAREQKWVIKWQKQNALSSNGQDS
jgi:hypothetical protein